MAMSSGSRQFMRSSPVCQICEFALQQPRCRPSIIPLQNGTRSHTNPHYRLPYRLRQLRNASTKAVHKPIRPQVVPQRAPLKSATAATPPPEPVDPPVPTAAAAEIAKAQADGDALLGSNGIPKEEEVLAVLKTCLKAAQTLLAPAETKTNDTRNEGTPASALLSLDRQRPSKTLSLSQSVSQLSELAYTIVKHPPVFITEEILSTYVELQSLLRRPRSFPEIFDLYASKPSPHLSGSVITYKPTSPNRPNAAIPSKTANAAISSALEIKHLDLAIAIIETTFRTTAFRRNRFIRKALLPITGLSLAPLAMWKVAGLFSEAQNTMEPETATYAAFAGFLTYVGCTVSIGLVAVTTSNDQMDRVTWQPGIPLRERWLREEERAAIDRVAGAWGFTDVYRRGEEEGEEWEALKEWIGVRGMVLDRTELMEGMR